MENFPITDLLFKKPMIEIKLFRMATGEEVVAELVSEDETTVTIKNGLVVFPNQNQTVGFAPWALVPDKSNPELNVNRQHIVYITDVDPGVKGKYNEIYGSKLVTPEEKKLII